MFSLLNYYNFNQIAKEIKNEKDWELDPIYKEAVEENILSMLKTSKQQILIIEELEK